MEETLIDVRGLTVKAGKRSLLYQVDWSVRKGEQWVVFGANGSGKTTLLSAVSGFHRIDAGKIRLFGSPLGQDNIFDIRKRIGWASGSFFDDYYKNESPLEIVLSSKTGTLGLDFDIDEKDVARAKELLSRFGVVEKCNMPFCSMSKGERQEVLLARALFNSPDILVLDEPCTGLDLVARERVLLTVDKIVKDGQVSVVYVTHHPDEILDCFNRALLIKQGMNYLTGTIGECFNDSIMTDYFEVPVSIDRDRRNRMHAYCDVTIGEVQND